MHLLFVANRLCKSGAETGDVEEERSGQCQRVFSEKRGSHGKEKSQEQAIGQRGLYNARQLS